MDFNLPTTAVLFLVLIVVGVGGASMSPMGLETVLMMVLPSTIVFGFIVLLLGIKHGEYRARSN